MSCPAPTSRQSPPPLQGSPGDAVSTQANTQYPPVHPEPPGMHAPSGQSELRVHAEPAVPPVVPPTQRLAAQL